MAARDEVLRLLIEVQGAGQLDALIAELKQAAAEHLRMRRHMVCHFIAPSPELSPAQWDALLAERERVGRALCDREARAVLEEVDASRSAFVHSEMQRALTEVSASVSSAALPGASQ